MKAVCTRFILAVILVWWEINWIWAEKVPPFKKKKETIDENIPRPNKKDKVTFELRSLHEPSLLSADYQNDEVHIHDQGIPTRSVGEEQMFDNIGDGGESGTPNVRVTKGKTSPDIPTTYLMDIDQMKTDHPANRLRDGEATNTDTCDKVRAVPSALRNADVMYAPINKFYTQYTEAYGIPVIGSKYVTKEGLKRACYTVRAMFASNYNIRNAYYKFFAKVALIADNEQQTSLYEYNTWDANYWNNRARGLGPTRTIPLASAGDDNQRCRAGDRYFDQDILVHELAHGVHTMASRYVIPGFEQRLTDAYNKNIKGPAQKWANTYAATSKNEYFAVASQFYFNSFRGSSYKKFNVINQASLRKYDKDITKLLDEVYSCFTSAKKNYVHRCKWKSADCPRFTLKYSAERYRARANCEILKNSTTRETVRKCERFTCYYLGNAFNWRGSTCIAMKCKYDKTGKMDFAISQNSIKHGIYDIYYTDRVPKMRLQELSMPMKKHCTEKSKSIPCKVAASERKVLKFADKEPLCTKIGGCFTDNKCYFPDQRCTNKLMACSDMSVKGECKRNWPFMFRKCATACDKCANLQKYTDAELISKCQDTMEHCLAWEKMGECQRNPSYMNRHCRISCKSCKL